MDRRRAAGALLALAACIATSAAAPTASNHTALDLYDEPTEGCYYNFQHYGEGDRIMTNEPCLNCTCHNRMLMCYLRVCPFTKAIGQDCTVEKRADQCCPIVTCPDVPVDLLTSTSTSSPAEYGGTGVGKVDKYGCSINGKYFPEGAKVPPTPGKPCEHCYCIRNMTTCVMQECTLHVDGCTPIYHKDVCCPVRYFCDHPEDEIPLLDDMTTTVRPTPGFLLTTTAPTEAPEITTQPARRDCIEDDQLYPDGALIKTEKPCEHCYCMKGDIVCVVQECGTPMENEGKNCTSLPPREGQCCPDTYICEGDELSTETPSEGPITTIVPPRRVSVEGSGYRNEPDEMIPYTEVPTFATELEGSGEEDIAEKPQKETTEKDLIDKFGHTEEAEFIPLTTRLPIPEQTEKATTEPDKELNTVPSGPLDEELTESPVQEKTTLSDTESTLYEEKATTPKYGTEEEKLSVPSLVQETTPLIESKVTQPSVVEDQTTETSAVSEKEGTETPEKEIMPKEEEKATKSPTISEPEAHATTKPEEEAFTEISIAEIPQAHTTVKPEDKVTLQEELEAHVTAKPEEEVATAISIPEEPEAHATVKPEGEAVTEISIPEKPEAHATEKPEGEVVTEISTPEESAAHATDKPEGEAVTKISIPEGPEEHATEKPKEGIVTESSTTEEPEDHTTFIPEDKTTFQVKPEAHTTGKPEEEVVIDTSATEEPEAHVTVKPEKEVIAGIDVTEGPVTTEHETTPIKEALEPSEPSVAPIVPDDDEKTTIIPSSDESGDITASDARRTTSDFGSGTSPKPANKEIVTEAPVLEHITPGVTESAVSDQNTVPISVEEEQSTEGTMLLKTTVSDESKLSEIPSVTEQEAEPVRPTEEESIVTSDVEGTTRRSDIEPSEVPVQFEDKLSDELTTVIPKEGETGITTEPTFRREDEVTASVESDTEKELVPFTKPSIDISKETEQSSDKTTSTERISSSKPEAMEPTTEQLPEKQTQETTPLIETTTESIMELSPFAHVDDKESITTVAPESEAPITAATTEKMYFPEAATINPADNEIAEAPSPGRIPGEGDCLLEGTTYKNDSVVPSTNKCHSGCKCVSSIIKCNPIICSPPPEDMDNCQPRYDTPEACCPTYVCDHGMETIPPQPQSHITGTESPTPSTIECHGDECEKTEQTQPSAEPSQTPIKEEAGDCGINGCDQAVQPPAELCSDGKCEVSQPSEQPQEIPSPCSNPDDCKEIKLPCEGESCTASQEEPCDKDSGCNKPDTIPPQETPQVCTSEEECKQVKVPLPESASCQGESCRRVQEDCSTGECKVIEPQQPSQENEVCSEKTGCKQPDEIAECENGKCEPVDKTGEECTEDNCMQQQPISPTQETAYTGPISSEQPSSEAVTSMQEEEMQPVSSELPSTLSEEAATIAPAIAGELDKEVREPESPVSDEKDRATTVQDETVTVHVPEVTSENPVHEVTEKISPEEEKTTEGSATETPLDHTTVTIKAHEPEIPGTSEAEAEIKPTEQNTEPPKVVTEFHDVHADRPEATIEEEPEKSTEGPKQPDEIKSTELPEISVSVPEEGTRAPEEAKEEVTVSPESITGEAETETRRPDQEPEDMFTKSPVPEFVTEILPEETSKLPEAVEDSGEHGMKATEPSTFESQQTEEPETSTLFEKVEVTTKLSDEHDEAIATPSNEKDTVSDENIQTEAPHAHVTEPQDVATQIPTEETEKLSTSLPAETKLPTDVNDATTEVPAQPTISDEYVPTVHTPSDHEEVPESHIESQTTISPDKEYIVTTEQQAESEGEKETETKAPQPPVVEEEKETKSPLPLVTQPPSDMSTVSLIKKDEIPESTTIEPQSHESEDEMKTQAPESYEPEKTEAPEQPVTEQEPVTEKESIVTPPLREQQEPEEGTSAPITTELAESSISEEQEQPITSIPSVAKTKAPVADDQVTEISHGIKTPEEHEETINETTQSPTLATKPAITEEYEISTEEPEKPEEEDHEIAPIEPQDMVTKTPGITEESDNEKATEKPASEEEETVTKLPEAAVTQSQEIPENAAGEKDTTEIPLVEHEHSEIPGEFVTESPEIHKPAAHEGSTISPELSDTAPQKSSTEIPSEDESQTQPSETESSQEHEPEKEKEKGPVTNVPDLPKDSVQTQLPEAQVTAGTEQPEFISPEISEATTVSPQIQEEELGEKPTEQPIAELDKPVDKTGQEGEKDILTPVKFPESSVTPVETNTMISVSVEDKQKIPAEPVQTSKPDIEYSETTPYLVELEEHTHKMDDEPTDVSSVEPTIAPSDEPSIALSEEPIVAQSGETTIAPSEETAITTSEKSTVSPSEETEILTEKSTIIPLEPSIPSEVSTVALSGEHTTSSPEKPTIIASEEPATASPEEPTLAPSEEPTTARIEIHETEPHMIEPTTEKLPSEEQQTHAPEAPSATQEPQFTVSLGETSEKATEPASVQETTSDIIKPTDSLLDKFGRPKEEDKEKESKPTTPQQIAEEEIVTPVPASETEKPVSAEEPEKDVTIKPQYVPVETTAPEEEFIPVSTTAKTSTIKAEEESPTQSPPTKPEDKPSELPATTAAPEASKPDELQPTDEVLSPEDESHFPPSGGYSPESDYVEEDQAFGPGTCRYGGKVYVSAQQIPRDDPCDFCFCFRSDIICLQQSCPPPIHGCHEEPIQGFCCPRYECPVSMATTLNVTTTTTTTTTTLPPHFLPHAYKGAATRKGCQIKGHTYQVGEVVRASSGPCLHCTCGGDGQMKCDPKQCTPEPMLRQMIAAAVSAKRRR